MNAKENTEIPAYDLCPICLKKLIEHFSILENIDSYIIKRYNNLLKLINDKINKKYFKNDLRKWLTYRINYLDTK